MKFKDLKVGMIIRDPWSNSHDYCISLIESFSKGIFNIKVLKDKKLAVGAYYHITKESSSDYISKIKLETYFLINEQFNSWLAK